MSAPARVNPDRLLHNLLQAPKAPEFRFVLAAEAIYRRIAEAASLRRSGTRPLVFTGPKVAGDFVEAFAGRGMFSTGKEEYLVDFTDAFTKKEWTPALEALTRIPTPPDANAVLFLPAAARAFVDPDKLRALGPTWLSYPPSEADGLSCAMALAQRHGCAAKETTAQAALALSLYAGDLVALDQHFERMARYKLAFDDAFAGARADISPFHVLDALAGGRPAELRIKLRQCEDAKVEAPAVFATALSFIQQLCRVRAGLESRRTPLRAVFETERIPFPMQARFEHALRSLPHAACVNFLARAACTETALRAARDPFALLTVELDGILS